MGFLGGNIYFILFVFFSFMYVFQNGMRRNNDKTNWIKNCFHRGLTLSHCLHHFSVNTQNRSLCTCTPMSIEEPRPVTLHKNKCNALSVFFFYNFLLNSNFLSSHFFLTTTFCPVNILIISVRLLFQVYFCPFSSVTPASA